MKAIFKLTLILGIFVSSCAIDFEITSQITALENQMLGPHPMQDDEFYFYAAVRELKDTNQSNKIASLPFERATQNRAFNSDDVKFLKDQQIIGETINGLISLLPPNTGLVDQATKVQLKTAQLIIREENHDRQILWNHYLQNQPATLKSKITIDNIIDRFAKLQISNSEPGHWYQSEPTNKWIQKSAP